MSRYGETQAASQPQTQTQTQTPTLWSNVHDAAGLAMSVGTNWVAEGIRALGYNEQESVEANVRRLTDVVESANAALDSPEGVALKQELSDLLAELVEVSRPAARKATDVAIEGLTKLSSTGVRIVNTALNELPPVFLVNELSNLGVAAAQAGETAAKLSATGMEAWSKVSAQKARAQSLFARAQAMLAAGLARARQSVDARGQAILSSSSSSSPTAKEQTGGKRQLTRQRRQRKRQGQVLSRRIQASYAQFMGGRPAPASGMAGGKRSGNRQRTRTRKPKPTTPEPLSFLDTFVQNNHFRDLY